MSKGIKIKKGLNILLKGEAQTQTSQVPLAGSFAINPKDFHLVTPKLAVKEGASFKAGDVLFYNKANEAIKFTAPVAGTLKEITRGAKRVITQLKIETSATQSHRDFGVLDPEKAEAEAIKTRLLESGCWAYIKQRPYDVIANPETPARDIFISGLQTAPLAANLDYVLQGKEQALQAAVTALSKLTEGHVHITTNAKGNSPLAGLKNAKHHSIQGPHPAGNVGTQIAAIAPVNKGESVWTVAAHDLVIIGTLLLEGKYDPKRLVAVGGASVNQPKYIETYAGASITPLLDAVGGVTENARVISGNVLTGRHIPETGYLGFYDTELAIIPEGNDYEFFGWNKPIFHKISTSRALTFSWLFPKKRYNLNTNTNGEHRAFVVTGGYEAVFPMDIYPLQLLKACMVKDLDAMEALGMYEVAPEDFALTEFVCVSKQPHQQIIREGLDLMYKEIG